MAIAQEWIVIPRPAAAARFVLYCLPYAGGSLHIYTPWASRLAPELEVRAIQLPGHDMRIAEPPFSQFRPLVVNLAHVVANDIDRQFAIFGHSMGALVAFELVRELRRQGFALPKRLLISGFRAPHLAIRHRPLHRLRDEGLLRALRRLGRITDEVMANSEVISLFLPLLRAELTLTEAYAYTPEVPLACPISVFAGRDDPVVSYDEVDQWHRHSSMEVRIHSFPGGHFFILDAPGPVLDAIRRDVAT